MHPLLVLMTLAGAAVVLAWRMRETSRPINARKILIPPLGMATGFSMFVYPPTRIPLSWGLAAFAVGALFFCYPLVRSSQLRRVGDAIMLQRSRAFLFIFLGLLAVRTIARVWVEQYVSTMQTGALLFVLAFGMVLPWRVLMYREYRRLAG